MRPENLCLMILLSLSTGFGSHVDRTGFATKWTALMHKVVTTNVISVADNVVSGFECSMLCLEMKACVSVFYRQVLRRCQFHDVLFLSPEDGEEEIGTSYYSLTSGSCPSGYIHVSHLGLCYELHLKVTLYDDGVDNCASRAEHFIMIDSQEKQDYTSKQLHASSGTRDRGFFIDGSDAEIEGQWMFHDGRLMNFFAWREGYPKNMSGSDYLVASKFENPHLWVDTARSEKRYYMCQRDI